MSLINETNSIPLNPRWKAIWEHLRDCFTFHSARHIIESHLCTRNLWGHDGLYWNIHVPPVSSHERLEARIKWREWVQAHVPESEWSTILPDL